jgi:non-heme chloroperoxidase
MSFTHDAASARTPGDPGGLRPALVRLASGVSLSCIERGPRGGHTLLLLHGLADSCLGFEPLLEHLPASLHVVVPSLRGHGDSDRPEHGYELADFARDLGELLAALGIESAVIAGHSLGASIALSFALAHPERTRGLALLGAFARYRNNPTIAELAAVIATLDDPVDGAFVRDFQCATLAGPVAPAFLEQVIRESRRLPARVWQAVVDALLAPDAELPFARVRVPTLLLSGARDVFVPRGDQERFLAAIPGCRWREYPGGHGFHWELPALVAEELAGFALACNAGRVVAACPGQP